MGGEDEINDTLTSDVQVAGGCRVGASGDNDICLETDSDIFRIRTSSIM
jgi:hypothetical protein